MENDDDMLYWFRDFMVIVFLGIIVWLLSGCASSRKVTERSVRDSVVYTYKTVWHDSLRVKDSVRIEVKTKVRDSIVLKIDNATGKVISREAYHYADTNTDKNHAADVRNMVSKADSVNSTASKSQSSVVNQSSKNNAVEAKKTHYWRTWWIGVSVGILLSLIWKYRRKIAEFFVIPKA